MNAVLERWNALDAPSAVREVIPCCGSQAWAKGMAAARPFAGEEILYVAADAVWLGLSEAAWQEAFDSHPRIGESHAQASVTAVSLHWSGQEQQTALASDAEAKLALVDANRRYEARFGHIFIVCASGRSSGEILAILEMRMSQNAETELQEAAEQQRQITQIRLRRWLEGN